MTTTWKQILNLTIIQCISIQPEISYINLLMLMLINMKPNNYKTTTSTPTQMSINFNTGRENQCTRL